jgi:hypothetical protein
MPRPRTGGRQRVNRNRTIGWGSSGRMFQSGATYWLERLGTDHMWARREPLYGIGRLWKPLPMREHGATARCSDA